MEHFLNRILLILGSWLILSGCSTYFATNGEQRYLLSQNGPGIKVVSPLTDANISHFYDLPVQNKISKISILPPSIDLIRR